MAEAVWIAAWALLTLKVAVVVVALVACLCCGVRIFDRMRAGRTDR